MRIVTLLARHGTTKYADAIENIDELFAHQLPKVQREIVVIDNTLPEDYEKSVDRGRTLIGSSNAHWEFSAWDRGIAYLGRRIETYDLVHLATSAFRSLYIRYLDRFNENMLSLIVGRGAAVGHIDYFNEPVVLLGRSLQAWIRTSFFFIPPEELRLLGSLTTINDPGRFFSGNPDRPFCADAPLSTNYQKFILDWLTGGGTGQGVEWHSCFRLTAETLPYFEAKTVAMLNEQMLGVRLSAQGCAMVDATWLAARSTQLPPGQPLGAIPNWRWQITKRDTDAAPQTLIT